MVGVVAESWVKILPPVIFGPPRRRPLFALDYRGRGLQRSGQRDPNFDAGGVEGYGFPRRCGQTS